MATTTTPRSPAHARSPAQAPVVRVASVPTSHVYVRHLADPDGPDGVVRLPDVPPADGAKVPGGWWPPVILDSAWIRDHRDEFDVFHVHFGFDAKTPAELQDVVDALDECGVPLVLTVHDLRNPHHADRELHDAQLSTLIRGATALVTLTPGAAGEIRRRWGREAHVIAHPHVVEPERMLRSRPRRPGFVVGVHAKSLRANMDVLPVAETLAETVAGLPGATLRIDLHHELLDPGNHWHAPERAAELLALGREHEDVEVRVHPYFSDDELWDYLQGLDVSVLPYRFGTHSGWLEACHDLGTAVIAPDCGHYAEQSGCHVYRHGEDRLDPASLRDAVVAAYGDRHGRRAGCADRDRVVAERLEQRRGIAAAHGALYRALLD